MLILKKSEEKGGRTPAACDWLEVVFVISPSCSLPSPLPPLHKNQMSLRPCVPAFGVKIAQKCLGFDYFSYFCIKYRRYAVKTVQAQSDLIP